MSCCAALNPYTCIFMLRVGDVHAFCFEKVSDVLWVAKFVTLVLAGGLVGLLSI